MNLKSSVFLRVAGATLAATCGVGYCGSYGPQNFGAYPSGTTNLGDGTQIESNNGQAQVRGNSTRYLQLTRDGTPNTQSSFKLPDLDPGQQAAEITLEFDLYMDSNGSTADGMSVNFGTIPAGNGGGEAGFAMANGLTIAWDTYNNGGDPPSVEIFADGVSIANFLFSSLGFNPVDGEWRPVRITWDESGLDLSYDGNILATDLAVPGFLPKAGDRCAFSARTGGADQSTRIDSLSVTTRAEVPVQTGGPVIREFMADNGDTLEDDFVEKPDWIEIYNGQSSAVNLSGYYLTDTAANPVRWRFPSITLQPYGHLLVYASGKNRTLPAAPLHTNFALARDGGYLALVAPNGTTVLSHFNYGPQVTDISFGEKGPQRTVGYLETPTPGMPNSGAQAAGPPAEEVRFDRDGGVFSGAATLSILAPQSPGAVIRYTTNGTLPDESSPVFSGTPLAISATTTVRARVHESGRLPGPVKTVTLLKLANDLATFDSALPIVVADSFGVDIDLASDPLAPRPFRNVYTVVIDRDPDGFAKMTGTPDFVGRGGMHVRGQSSAGFPQKQYAWETWDENNQDKKVTVLDFPVESDWVLHAPYTDKTLMRNALAYGLARDLHGNSGGMRTRYVELFMNADGGEISMDDYRGVYVIVEKIKRDPNRVDIEKLNPLVTSPELVTGGYLFKKDKEPYSQPWTTATEGVPLDTHDPEVLNSAQSAYLRGYVNDFESTLYGAGFTDPQTGYAAYIDVRSFIDNHLVVELLKNIDGFRISQYYHKTRAGKIRALPVWDYNLAFGNANYNGGQNPTGWYHSILSGTDYYWYPRLFQDPEFVLSYWDRFWQLRRGLFSDAALLTRIDASDTELDAPNSSGISSVTRNFGRWSTLGNYVWPNADGYQNRTTHQSEVDWMKNWLTTRIAWAESQSRGIGGAARPPAWNSYGGPVESGFTLAMTNPNSWSGAQIRYTTDGSDPRGPTALTYTGPVQVTQAVEIRARVTDGARWSPLAQGVFAVNAVPASADNLVISEIHYHPANPDAAEIAAGFLEDGEFEFIELTNVHPTSVVDLTGVAFVNGISFVFDDAVPTAARFLPPGGRVVLVSNASAFAFRHGGSGAVVAGVYGGALDNSGERLALMDAQSGTIRDFTYDDAWPWPFEADGDGYSLVLVSPASLPDHGEPANWRASTDIAGNPGGTDAVPYPGNPDEDEDGDGLNALLELAMGTSDTDASSRSVPGLTRQWVDMDGTEAEHLMFEFQVNTAAEWADFTIESCDNLTDWEDASGDFFLLETEPLGGGISIRRYATLAPFAPTGNAKRFYRLQVTPHE